MGWLQGDDKDQFICRLYLLGCNARLFVDEWPPGSLILSLGKHPFRERPAGSNLGQVHSDFSRALASAHQREECLRGHGSRATSSALHSVGVTGLDMRFGL